MNAEVSTQFHRVPSNHPRPSPLRFLLVFPSVFNVCACYRTNNWKVQNMPSDGNCLLSSLSIKVALWSRHLSILTQNDFASSLLHSSGTIACNLVSIMISAILSSRFPMNRYSQFCLNGWLRIQPR